MLSPCNYLCHHPGQVRLWASAEGMSTSARKLRVLRFCPEWRHLTHKQCRAEPEQILSSGSDSPEEVNPQ
eukprot:5590586-Amphidinium_carterae.1